MNLINMRVTCKAIARKDRLSRNHVTFFFFTKEMKTQIGFAKANTFINYY